MAKKFSEGHNIVLLENHGVVSVGKDLLDAYAGFDSLIHLARVEINSATLGKLHSPTRQLQPYRSVPMQESWSFFVNNKLDYVEHRKDICDFTSRAYSQELFTVTTGSICSRVDSDYLVTPLSVDRAEIIESDIVLVRGQHCEEGKTPSDFTSIFISIINGKNNFNCVFFAQPAHLMAFNLTGIEFSSRIIPEAYIFLRDVKVLPQDELLSVSEYMNDACPIVMVENVGVFVAGDSMFRAFDRLELLEFTAKSLIGAYQLGGIQTISEERINELVKALNLPE